MERFAGQALPKAPRIALLSNDAIGNFVLATCVANNLISQYQPGFLAYFGGTRSLELQARSPLFHANCCLYGTSEEEFLSTLSHHQLSFDLVVNLEYSARAMASAPLLAKPGGYVAGPSVGDAGRGELTGGDPLRSALLADKNWARPDLAASYPFLRSGFIGEIFCRLAYVEGDLKGYQVPVEPSKQPNYDVVIAMSASLPEKLWATSKWCSVLSKLKEEGKRVALVGAARKNQSSFWNGIEAEDEVVAKGLAEDLRGILTLPQVAGLIEESRSVLTLDNGIMHIAVATNTPTVALFREGIHHLWMPPFGILSPIVSSSKGRVEEIPASAVLQALGSV